MSQSAVKPDGDGYSFFAIPWDSLGSVGDPLAGAQSVIIKALSSAENAEVLNVTVTNNANQECLVLKAQNVQTNEDVIKSTQDPPPEPVPKKEEPINCPLCEATFTKVFQYRLHMTEHKNAKKYKCQQCKESYNVETNFKIHMAVHQKGTPVCPICHRKFQRLASLKSHLYAHQVEETFACAECYAEFEKEDEYTDHLETHRTDNVEIICGDAPLVCSFCTYIFTDADKYKEHVGLHLKAKRLVINNKRGKKRKICNNKQFPHKCDLCPKSFMKLCLLERHRRSHTGEKPFLCEICKKGFTQNCTLQLHIATQHTGTKSITCMFCPAKFTQKGNYRVHLEKTHSAGESGEKVYKCSHCTCVFKKLSSLNGHVTKVHAGVIKKDEMVTTITTVIDQLKDLDKQSKAYIQEVVDDPTPPPAQEETDTNFESFVKLADSSVEGCIKRYVIKQRRYGDGRWFICSYCAKEFKKPSDLIRHIRIHTKERPFECLDCGQTFAQKSTLRNHLVTHTKQDYDCVLCAKKFSSLRTLNIHLRKHDKTAHARKTHSYKCSVCSKTFGTIEKAKEHIMVHDVADTVFIRKDEVKNDIVMKEPMIETENGLFSIAAAKPKIPYATLDQFKHRPFRCHVCSAAFLKSFHLKRHMQTHSGTKDHKCEICEKAFYTAYGLKEHMNYHMQVKKHECKYCKKRFYTNSALKRHMCTANASKPYICPYCKKRFRLAYSCRKHIKLVHRRDLNVSLLGLMDSGDINIDTTKVLDLADDINEVPFTTINTTTDDPVPIVAYSNISTTDKLVVHKELPKKKPKKQVVEVTEQIVFRPPNSKPTVKGDLIKATELRPILPKPINTDPVDAGPIEMTIENLPDNTITYPTIFITHEELQMLSNANVVNSLLPQLKLQNTDPLLLSSINELQDSNILYPIEPLSQDEADYQAAEAQSYDSFNPNMIFSSNDLNLNLNLPEKNSTEIDKSDPLAFNEAMDLELQQMAAQKTDPNNLIILNADEPKNLEMNYFNLNFQQNDYIDINTLNLPPNASIGKVMQPNTLQGADLLCSDCKVVFKSVTDMEKHGCVQKQLECDEVKTEIVEHEVQLKQESQPEETKCPHCDRDMKDNAKLIRHISARHKETIDNTCSFCPKKFKKRSDLVRHLRTHTGEKPFACEKCDKTFRLKSTLQSHYRTHSTIVSKNFKCHVCDTFFSCKSSLKTHTMIHTDIKKYACELCSSKFRVAHHLRSHMLWHKKESDMQAKSKINLFESILLDTNDEINNTHNLSDEIVGLDTLKSDELNTDAQNLLETDLPLSENLALKDPMPFDPMLLQSNFLNMGMQLEINGQIINVKATIDESLLNECENENLLTQELVESEMLPPPPPPVSDKKKVQCADCFKFYATKSVLTKHRKLMHGGHKCDKCGKSFLTVEELEKHSRLHSGYRPFSCPLCANSFTEEASLKVHVKRIHNIQMVGTSSLLDSV